MGLVPVAKTRTHKLPRSCPGCAFENKMLAVEEIRRVFLIARDVRRKTRKRLELSFGPFPAIADEVLDAPRVGVVRVGIYGGGRPPCKIQISRGRLRSRRAVRGAVEFRFARKSSAAPARIGPSFRQTNIDRPARDLLERQQIK